METPTIGMLASVAGIGFIGTIICEVILRAGSVSGETKDRFGPLLAVLVGIILGIVGAVAGNTDIVVGLLTGIVAGGTSMGIHDVVTGSIAPAVSGGPTG